MDNRVIGMLGGGQLGRMLQEAANRLNVKVVLLDAPNAPAKQINATHPHINGSFANPNDVRKLAQECDILTVEIEHVDTEVLEEISDGTEMRDDWRLVKSKKVSVQPSWKTIRVIQDKYIQKEHLLAQGIATTQSKPIGESSKEALEQAGEDLGYPFMLKSRTQAYDGRGNFPVHSSKGISAALETLTDRPLYAEKWANFKMELAVMVVKTYEDASVDSWKLFTSAFPVVETIHEDSICKLVYAPARGVSNEICEKAQGLARQAVSSFWGKGVFGVEMFLLEDGEFPASTYSPLLMSFRYSIS
jgi:phosphoribosylaminoimidazole carboxylase